MKRPRSVLAGLLLASSLLFPACVFQDDDEESGLSQLDVSVQAFDFYFNPTTVILEQGVEATITLQNMGSQTHSFTVPDLDIEIEAQGAGNASTTFVTPEETGAFEFICKFHSEMTGAVSIGQDDDTTIDEDDSDVEVETEETEG